MQEELSDVPLKQVTNPNVRRPSLYSGKEHPYLQRQRDTEEDSEQTGLAELAPVCYTQPILCSSISFHDFPVFIKASIKQV